MLYTIMEVGDKELKLRMRIQDCVMLEKEIGCNPLSIFIGIKDGELPTISDTAALLHASLQAMEHDYTKQAVYELLDEWVASGKTIIDLYAVLTDVLSNAGLLPKDGDGEKNE